MKKQIFSLFIALIILAAIPQFSAEVLENEESTEMVGVGFNRQFITNERLAEMVENGTIPQNVTSLWLSNNLISDISPLAGLTDLIELDLSHNQIEDISLLSGLTNLGKGFLTGGLNLGNNQISDITPLQNLTHLQTLALQNNQITDVTPLQNLTNLWFLDLRNNQIEDVMPLVWLSGLDSASLVLRGNPVADDTEQLAALRAARSRNAHRTTLTLGHVLGTEPYTVNDALEILRYTVGLPSVLDNCTVAVIAALIVNEEVPDVRDALQILRSLVGLSSAFDE
jgi:hypothetical protein